MLDWGSYMCEIRVAAVLFVVTLACGCGAVASNGISDGGSHPDIDAAGSAADGASGQRDTGLDAPGTTDAVIDRAEGEPEDDAASDDALYNIDDAGLNVVDAGPGQSVCGTTKCSAATQICCLTIEVGSGAVEASCTAQNACGGTILACSGSESCTEGDNCCAELGGNRLPLRSQCSPSACNSVALGTNATLCTANWQCPGEGPCHAVGAGYGVCWPSSGDAGASD